MEVLDIDDVPGSNARRLAESVERDVDKITAGLREATDGFLELTDHADPADAAFWHGLDTTVGALFGIFLGELLLHGRDVAGAAAQPWPISKTDATMIFEGAPVVAHEFLDEAKVRNLRATYGLHLRGGRSFTFTFEDGKLAVTDGIRGRVDCRVSADPRSLVLVLYRRSNQWAQIGRGGLFAYGRKPWLALRFADLFKSV